MRFFTLDGQNPTIGGRPARIDGDIGLLFYFPVASLEGIHTSVVAGLVSRGMETLTSGSAEAGLQRRR